MASSPLTNLSASDKASGLLNVVIDTPRGSRVKYKLDVDSGIYKASHYLAPGLSFPFDFGSVPGTLAEDGDPLDALVLSEEPSFVGCLVPARLLGVIEARQTQRGKSFRNDRLIAVAGESGLYRDVRTLRDVSAKALEEIDRFFVSYNESRGRKFAIRGKYGERRARRAIAAAERRFEKGR